MKDYLSKYQEQVVKKAKWSLSAQLRNLKEENLTWDKIEEVIEPFLNQVFSVGYYYGTRQSSHQKPVRQYKDGVYVRTWPSRIQAARAFGVHKTAIGKSIKHGFVIKGSIFKEYNEE